MKMGKTLRLLTLASSLVVIGCTEDVAVHETYYDDRRVRPRYVREEPRPLPREDSDVRVSVDARGEEAPPVREAPPADSGTDVAVSYDSGDARTDVDVVSEAPDESDVTYFQDDLQPYGDWVVTADFGRCFHPRGISADWRPYSEGHWVYTDDGWLWASDEPFGWATSHYGRWYEDSRAGWVWVPGRTWSPAWVAWRHGGGSAGWAALPPVRRGEASVSIDIQIGRIRPSEYCFVDERYIDAPRVRDHFRPREQNVTIINNTTNITNITTVNNRVVNHGVSTLEVEQATGHKVKKVQVVAAASKGVARDNGNQVAVFKPNIPPKKKKPVLPADGHAADAKNVSNNGGLQTLENDPNATSKNKKKIQTDTTPPRNPADATDANPPKKKPADKNAKPLATDDTTATDAHKPDKHKTDNPVDPGKSDNTPIDTHKPDKHKPDNVVDNAKNDDGKSDSSKADKKVKTDEAPQDVSNKNKKKVTDDPGASNAEKSGKNAKGDDPKADPHKADKSSKPDDSAHTLSKSDNGGGKGNGRADDQPKPKKPDPNAKASDDASSNKKKDKNGNDTGDAVR